MYRSASEGTLTPERVIERAAEGKLVLGEGGLGLGLLSLALATHDLRMAACDPGA